MKSWAPACLAAWMTSSRLAPGLPYWMFSKTVPENRYTSCWTKPIWSRRDFKVTSWMFWPSMRMRPSSTS